METSDRELLQAFLRTNSGEAFRQFVERHLPMVLGTFPPQFPGLQ